MTKTFRTFSLILCIVMILGVLPMTALAAGSGNFSKSDSFSDGMFTDVKTTDWFYDTVKSSYQYGLMVGNSATTFNPSGNVKISEAITIAARMNSVYTTGKDEFVQGNPWYQTYVDYAKANKIITKDYADYNKAATRAEFAEIFASALPSEELNAINIVDDDAIPDVKSAEEYAPAVYLLYRAGILVGSDSSGSFNPDSNIKRSEVATIASRMVDKTLRQSIMLGSEFPEEELAEWDTKPCRFYVSTHGKDTNDGSKGAPFATNETAIGAVRGIDRSSYTSITVWVAPGEYRTRQLSFLAQDSGTENCIVSYKAVTPGTVTLNGGVSVALEDFSPVEDSAVLARLSATAKDKVRSYDLKTLGLTEADWGKIHVIGTYHTANNYDGDYIGDSSCEVFFDDERMTLSRYPDTGYLETDAVAAVGYNASNSDFASKRNPEGDTYTLNKTLASRVASWKTLDDVWMYGYWMNDWADASTPIGSFDSKTGKLKTKFVSRYGAKKGAPYYFFNVLEELDSEGEWYLDRESGILYIIPPKDKTSGTVSISISTKALLAGWLNSYNTFDGFVVCNTRGDGISINSKHNTIENCVVKNVAGHGIVVWGTDNLICHNEITHTGCAGILLNDGDQATLTAANNIADNNYIHDWSEITQTYMAGIAVRGTGNRASHNEIVNSPHVGILYSGNNHVIENNVIRNVCQMTADAGAIYAGASWSDYGNVIRYNLIESPGNAQFAASGIYWDDAISGQTAYGNILINVPGYSFKIGGGRDLEVTGNIVITNTGKPIEYDDRAIAGITSNGWFTQAKQGGNLWNTLNAVPWQSETWQKAYPAMKNFITDFSKTSSAGFIANPANSHVTGNILVSKSNSDISAAANKFSKISGNFTAKYTNNVLTSLFKDPANGDYTLLSGSDARKSIPDFKDIPCSDIGRYDW